MNVQKIVPYTAGDCPSKATKHSGAVHRVNLTANTHKNTGNIGTVTGSVFTNAPLHANQQQQSPCSSPSGSSCSSPITKPL